MFRLTEDNTEAVGEICRRLDGLPLAVEFAALWMKVLPSQELMERLDHGLTPLPDGPRDLPVR